MAFDHCYYCQIKSYPVINCLGNGIVNDTVLDLFLLKIVTVSDQTNHLNKKKRHHDRSNPTLAIRILKRFPEKFLLIPLNS